MTIARFWTSAWNKLFLALKLCRFPAPLGNLSTVTLHRKFIIFQRTCWFISESESRNLKESRVKFSSKSVQFNLKKVHFDVKMIYILFLPHSKWWTSFKKATLTAEAAPDFSWFFSHFSSVWYLSKSWMRSGLSKASAERGNVLCCSNEYASS